MKTKWVKRLLIPITIGTIFIRYLNPIAIGLRLRGLIPRVLGAKIFSKKAYLNIGFDPG